jgi:hypothetical protein
MIAEKGYGEFMLDNVSSDILQIVINQSMIDLRWETILSILFSSIKLTDVC